MEKLKFLLLIVATFFLYVIFTNRTPIHLNQDELGFSLNAYSLAKTGFDENERFLPLYFWHLGVMWATPIIVYLTAIILSFLPLSEIAIRLPSVVIGLTNVILVYFLAKKIFKSGFWGLAAGALLATTPVHFIHSRILLDVLYIVPFVLGWLLLLVYFFENKNPWLLLIIGLVLGIGIHSYHAAKIMMPFYLILTLIFVSALVKKKKQLFLPIIGFVLPILPLIPWLSQYPDTLVDQVRYTRLYDTGLGPFAGIATILTPENLGHRLDVFILYFNPVFLFLLGDRSLIHSTSLYHPLGLSESIVRAGVFLLSFAAFLPLGIYSVLKKERNRLFWLLLIGFFTAPIAAVLIGDHYRISRALVILPFAIILTTFGAKFLIEQKKKIFRVACYFLLIAMPLQFSYFLYDYFADYRIRSYNWMKYNIPGALEEVISQETREPASYIFIDRRIEFVDRYWRFYLIKHNKEELLTKTIFFEPRDIVLEELSENSIILYNFNNVDGLKTEIGPFHKTANIFEPDGVSTFYVYRN